MSRTIAQQLFSDARRGVISKTDLLRACMQKLESISEEELYCLALNEGFIHTANKDLRDDTYDFELKKLDATQRIIEKVLSRYGD